MSVAYYIVLDNGISGSNTFVHSRAIAKAADTLDHIAHKLSLPDIDDFLSMTSMELQRLLQEDLISPIQEESWFSPAEGIVFFERLAKHLLANPYVLDDASAVIRDLAEYQGVLQNARKINARWHLGLYFT